MAANPFDFITKGEFFLSFLGLNCSFWVNDSFKMLNKAALPWHVHLSQTTKDE